MQMCQLASTSIYEDMGSPYGAIPPRGGEEGSQMGSQMGRLEVVISVFLEIPISDRDLGSGSGGVATPR